MACDCARVVLVQVKLEKEGIFNVLQSRFDVPKADAVCPYCLEYMGMTKNLDKEDEARLKTAKEAKDGYTILEMEYKYRGEEDTMKTDNLSCHCAKIPAALQSCGHHVHVGCYITSVLNRHFACPTCTVVPEKFRENPS